MKIYTKTGDKGETSLHGGKRVSKSALRIETYGTVDELNSVIGICRALNPPQRVDEALKKIQNQLFTLGADLASPLSNAKNKNVPRISDDDSKFLEELIDKLDSEIKPLRSFILPGGSLLSAQIHFARTVCRRAERLVVQLSKKEKTGTQPIIYLNRLSDFLFVLARWVNHLERENEIIWTKKI
ncbi:MAG: cob(I)yrinic acid a,c-diamide adenosyltransferase [Bacteroidota bacterium]|nr:cob(I)yrinic acid a,c-diamide adenosyltransferase [Bacteroidota bacterium]